MWDAMRRGDRRAFEDIYNNEVSALISYGQRFSMDKDLVEDSVHDVFIYIWKTRERLNTLAKIRPYLFVSLRHAILNKAKKNKRTEHKEINDSFLDNEDSIEQHIIDSEFQAELTTRLNESYKVLSSRQKEAIFLKFHNSMDYEDICEIMDISYQSVRNLISTGTKKLYEYLKEKK